MCYRCLSCFFPCCFTKQETDERDPLLGNTDLVKRIDDIIRQTLDWEKGFLNLSQEFIIVKDKYHMMDKASYMKHLDSVDLKAQIIDLSARQLSIVIGTFPKEANLEQKFKQVGYGQPELSSEFQFSLPSTRIASLLKAILEQRQIDVQQAVTRKKMVTPQTSPEHTTDPEPVPNVTVAQLLRNYQQAGVRMKGATPLTSPEHTTDPAPVQNVPYRATA